MLSICGVCICAIGLNVNTSERLRSDGLHYTDGDLT